MKKTNFSKRIFLICMTVFCIAALMYGCSKKDDKDKNDPSVKETTTEDKDEKDKEGKDNDGKDDPSGDKDGSGDKTQAGDFTIEENENDTVTLIRYNGNESDLNIPSKINGKEVSMIGKNCFAGLLCLKKVHIPEGVEIIGDYAFECCPLLRKVYFPESLKVIGDGAFSGCTALVMADMQDEIESIGKGAFLCCDSLVQLELPEKLNKLGDFAFAYCGFLTNVNFTGDKLTVLPDRAFYGCTSLTRVNLPESIKSVGKRAFSKCENISSLYFANKLDSVGEFAFENCSKLTSISLSTETIPTGMLSGCSELSWFMVEDGTVSIKKGAFGSSGIKDVSVPASVKDIEAGAFYQMFGSISLDEGNKDYRLIDGSLYTADGKTLIAYFPADPYAEEPQKEFSIADGVEVIAAYALAERGLEKVSVPASLKKVEAYAFAYSETEVKIPEGVSVDKDAFISYNNEDGEGSEDKAGTADENEAGTGNEDETGKNTEDGKMSSAAGDRNIFSDKDYAAFHEISNEDFDNWCEKYLAYNEANGNTISSETIPYILRYKGEVVPHYLAMTSVQNHDPEMWAEAAEMFGDDFEQMYIMMNHGLSTELARGKMEEAIILYSGLYDSQLMAAAGTDKVPTTQQLIDSIGNTFSDPIMISTTTDPGVAAGFGDTLFIIYASPKAMESLGAVCIDAVVGSSEKEILMNDHARYKILDVGTMTIEHKEEWDTEPEILHRNYVKVELLENQIKE